MQEYADSAADLLRLRITYELNRSDRWESFKRCNPSFNGITIEVCALKYRQFGCNVPHSDSPSIILAK